MPAGRPPKIMRPAKLTTYLPEDVRARLDLHLFSEVEGRVPLGAYTRFFEERVREFFAAKSASPLTVKCPDCGFPLASHTCPVPSAE